MKSKQSEFFDRPNNSRVHYQAKLIDSKLKDSSVGKKKTFAVNSDFYHASANNSILIGSTINEGSIRKSSITESLIEETSVIKSQVISSVVRYSDLEKSYLFKASIESSNITGSVINGGAVARSNIYDNAYIAGIVRESYLIGAIVESRVTVEYIDSNSPLYFKHGEWRRIPEFIDDPDLMYIVAEDVDDRVLIGCQSRPGNFWLDLTEEQAYKFGDEFGKHFKTYREAVQEIMSQKEYAPSPIHKGVYKTEANQWRLDNGNIEANHRESEKE